jgi:hypothetical protein
LLRAVNQQWFQSFADLLLQGPLFVSQLWSKLAVPYATKAKGNIFGFQAKEAICSLLARIIDELAHQLLPIFFFIIIIIFFLFLFIFFFPFTL